METQPDPEDAEMNPADQNLDWKYGPFSLLEKVFSFRFCTNCL